MSLFGFRVSSILASLVLSRSALTLLGFLNRPRHLRRRAL